MLSSRPALVSGIVCALLACLARGLRTQPLVRRWGQRTSQAVRSSAGERTAGTQTAQHVAHVASLAEQSLMPHARLLASPTQLGRVSATGARWMCWLTSWHKATPTDATTLVPPLYSRWSELCELHTLLTLLTACEVRLQYLVHTSPFTPHSPGANSSAQSQAGCSSLPWWCVHELPVPGMRWSARLCMPRIGLHGKRPRRGYERTRVRVSTGAKVLGAADGWARPEGDLRGDKRGRR
jgi:hypothetical protein